MPKTFAGNADRSFWETERRDEVLQLFRKHVNGEAFRFGKVEFVSLSPKKPLADAKG